ncbi:MAG: hypothetical protein IJS09_07565 [Treponema sp.]|nr:hypothetical protein [Treponema sp.]
MDNEIRGDVEELKAKLRPVIEKSGCSCEVAFHALTSLGWFYQQAGDVYGRKTTAATAVKATK